MKSTEGRNTITLPCRKTNSKLSGGRLMCIMMFKDRLSVRLSTILYGQRVVYDNHTVDFEGIFKICSKPKNKS